MRKIIASLDIGSYSIKLIVGEIQKNKLNILSCIDVESQGIKKGYIINPESAILALQKAFNMTEELIGLPIKKVLVGVPADNLECFMSKGSVIIKSEDKVIKHDDLIKAMQASVYKKIEDNKELVSILPTKFMINDDEVVQSPVNMIANKLTVNDVAIIIPKNNTETIIKCLEKINVQVIDIVVEPLADYYEYKNPEINKAVGAIVNMGYYSTNVSIFNKGILTATEVLDIGNINIDNDLAYIFKISKKDASYLKERLVTADINLAQPAESITLKNISGEDVKINEYDASAVVISRLDEIFNLIKKQINLLTKKEISYIIVSGAISELSSIDRYLNDKFGDKYKNTQIEEIGARDNKYSVAIGMIKYYNSRLKLRNVDYSIFSLEEQEDFGGVHKRVNINENSILGKIYGYFFDN